MKLEELFKEIWSEPEDQKSHPLKLFLRLLSLPYAGAVKLRNSLYDKGILKSEKIPCPVISVGNLTVGGTGKTPAAILVAGMLRQSGYRPAVLSRGYGGRSAKAVTVVSDGAAILAGPDEGGDEPFLIAKSLPGVPVLTGPRRYRTGKYAIEKFGADVLVLDDGFQHRAVFRDLDIVLLDSRNPLGNGYLLPRGPLREPMASLRRAGGVVLTRARGGGNEAFEARLVGRFPDLPVFRACHRPAMLARGDGSMIAPEDLRGKRVFAFAGIAQPESLRETLESLDAVLAGHRAFPDHHRYTLKDITEIEEEAKTLAADLVVTTEKDAVKLSPFAEFMAGLCVLPVEMEILSDRDSFENLIRQKIEKARDSAGSDSPSVPGTQATVQELKSRSTEENIEMEARVEKKWTTTLILWSFRLIPLSARRMIFRGLFRLFYHLSGKQRLITLHNLSRAFPEKSMEEIVHIARGVYRHLAIVSAEFFEMPCITRETLGQWAEVEGIEHYEKAHSTGKGILSIVAHFGNWELMTVAVPMLALPLQIVYRPLDSPVMDNLAAWVRTKHGNSLIPKGGSGKKIIRLLRENKVIGILSDQNVDKREGVFVDFFGRPACTSVGLAVLAMQSGAPVIPAFMPRMPDGKYRLIVLPAVEITRTGDYENDLLVNTGRFTKVVEDMVRRYPEQWFWLHQRWKTKPWQ